MSEYIYPSGQGENNKKIRYRISSAYLNESTIDYETAKSNYAQINVKGAAVEKSSTGVTNFEYSLSQNFPNPFNPSTVISYQLSAVSYVTLKVYDILGREVATLVDEVKEAGTHHYPFSIEHYTSPSGVYFYQLRVRNNSSNHLPIQTKKMLIIK
jgi:hypothetical protein